MSEGPKIMLAKLLKGAPKNKTVLLYPHANALKKFLDRAPDLDMSKIDKKLINTTDALCKFIVTSQYEKIIMLYHGTPHTLIIGEDAQGHETDQSFAGDGALLSAFQKVIQFNEKKVKEIEMLSCLVGGYCTAIFKIADLLGTKIIASNYLRVRDELPFKVTNATGIRTLERFRDLIVFGPNDNGDIQTALNNRGNKLAFQFFTLPGFEKHFREQMNYIDLTDHFGALDIRDSLRNLKQYAITEAIATPIHNSDEARDMQQSLDYQESPEFRIFSYESIPVEPLPRSEPRRGPNP